MKINCCYARFASWDGSEPLYKCRNSGSRNAYKIDRDVPCAACKERVPISKGRPLIIEQPGKPKQTNFKGHLYGA